MSAHLQSMNSTKDLENLEKSLCAKHKVENQYWMIVWPSGGTALEKGMVL